MYRLIPSLCIALLASACLQDRGAPIDQRGDYFYGREGAFDRAGNEVPRYSDARRAELPPGQDAKYVDDTTHQYGVSASVDSVGAADLPPVESTALPPVQAEESASSRSSLLPLDWGDTPAEAPAAPSIEQATRYTPQESSLSAAASATKTPDFVWPLKGRLLKDFSGSNQQGIAIAGRKGEPVRAASDGVVVHNGNKLEAFGNMIIIQHANGYVTTYGHLSASVVTEQTDVLKGQLIGFVGDSGDVDSPQLHFSIRQNTRAIDPVALLGE